MNASNEMVLDALHRVLYRQIPWHKRPATFSSLRAVGLIEPVRQRAAVGAREPASDIAMVTERGRAEIDRLERCRSLSNWGHERFADYAYGAVFNRESSGEPASK
jgi:hypothetical protein